MKERSGQSRLRSAQPVGKRWTLCGERLFQRHWSTPTGTRISTGTARGRCDRPLQAFYVEVNQSARDGGRVLATLDDARAMRYLKGYIHHMDEQLRGTN